MPIMKNPLHKNSIITLLLTFSVLFLATHTISGQCQIGADIDGNLLGERSGNSVSMPDAETIAIGAPYNNTNGTRSGAVRVHELVNGQWQQKGQTILGDGYGDQFGSAVSMPDENTLAVGAKYYDDLSTPPNFKLNCGQVIIYRYVNGQWIPKGQPLLGVNTQEIFGSSISMPDANTIGIGAPNGVNHVNGYAVVYSYAAGQWIQKGFKQYGIPGSNFGHSVSMPNNNTLGVGCRTGRYQNGNLIPGYARILQYQGSNWTPKGHDIIYITGVGFGDAVSMPDENTIAVGAPDFELNGPLAFEEGMVKVFTYSGFFAWFQKGQDIIGEFGRSMGHSLSMPDANTLAIGGLTEYNRRVDVRAFKPGVGLWIQKFELEEEDVNNGYGNSVSMPDKNTIGIGAQFNSEAGQNNGHAQVFDLKGADLPYYNSFDAPGAITCHWSSGFPGSGLLGVTSLSTPCSTSEHLVLSSTNSNMSRRVADLRLDLSTGYNPNTQDLFLTVTHTKGIHFSNDFHDGIFLSADCGVTFKKLTNFKDFPPYVFDCHTQTIKLNNIMTFWGMPFDENFVIRFSQESIAPFPGDGVAIDEVKVEAVNRFQFQRNFKKSGYEDLVTVHSQADQDFIKVQMPQELTEQGWEITLSDANGRIVSKQKSALHQTNIQIPALDLSSAMYFLKFENEEYGFNKRVFVK